MIAIPCMKSIQSFKYIVNSMQKIIESIVDNVTPICVKCVRCVNCVQIIAYNDRLPCLMSEVEICTWRHWYVR